jgi:hypothetical protein
MKRSDCETLGVSEESEMGNTIFETADLLVRYVKAGSNLRCAISFSSFTDEPRLDRPGFGESFLRDRGIDAIFVINRTNIWYQYPELPEALRVIRGFTKRYALVFTYGSSMGGYAAIRFAEAVGATTAIAISPQYSVSPQIVPFDKRWRAIARRIDFRHECRYAGSQRIEPLVFYDPRDADARHFELISQAYPRTTGVRLWHAGHPAGAYLSDTGVLTTAIPAILDGQFDAPAFERTARARRRMSGQYLFTLARRLPPWHWQTKMRLAAMALERREDAAHLIYLSMLVEREGRIATAERHLRRAGEVLPDHPTPLRALCVFLLRMSRFDEAVPIAEKLTSIDSSRDDYARFMRLPLLGAGGFDRLGSVVRRQAAAKVGRDRSMLSKLGGFGLNLLTRVCVDRAYFVILRPVALFRMRRKFALSEELKLFEEWRRPKSRKWRIFSRRQAVATPRQAKRLSEQ